jgi:hypothetical protein
MCSALVMGMLETIVSSFQFAGATVHVTTMTTDVAKTGLYYVLHAIVVMLLLLAILSAISTTHWKALSTGYRLAILLSIASAVLLAIRGMTFQDLFSTKVVSPYGPLLGLTALVSLTSTRRHDLVYMRRLFPIIAGMLTLVTWYSYYQLRPSDRSGFRSIGVFTWGILFPAVAILFDLRPPRWERVTAWAAILTVAGMGVLSQTRLPLILVSISIVAWVIVRYKRNSASTLMLVLSVALVSLCLALALRVAAGARGVDYAGDFFGGLINRLQDDSRSGQLVAFFADVRPQELILGRGAFATWNWNGITWPGGTDFGYLTLAFFGGLPLVAGFLGIHVLPAVRQLRLGVRHPEFCYAIPPLIFGLLMFSSEMPSLEVGYYIVLLCVGCCANTKRVETARFRQRYRGQVRTGERVFVGSLRG